MILRKNLRKRKHSSGESQDLDKSDKYVAYVRKAFNKKDKNNKDGETSAGTIATTSKDNLSISKAKRKKDQEKELKISNKCTLGPSVSIYAKPKLNKSIIKLNSTRNNEYKTNKFSTKDKRNKQKGLGKKNDGKKYTKMEIIMPAVSLSPPIPDDEPSTSESSQIRCTVMPSLAEVHEELNEICSPMIITANLKKSTKSYIPKILQSEEKIMKDYELVINEAPKTNKDAKQVTERVPTMDKSVSTEYFQDSHCDIPKALQDFYKEVTSEQNIQTDESVQKKSALTVDKSVKDCNNLIDIVQKNSVFLENLSCTNQESMIQFYSLENKVILILCPESQFSFLGKLKLKVLYGAVELYGSVFKSQNTVKPVEIYSPRGYSSITISTFELDDTYDKEALWDALTSEGVDRSLNTKLHDAIKECKRGWSVLLMENLENTLTNFLNNYYSFKLFPRVENMKYSWCDSRRAEYILQTNFQFSHSENKISICPQWNKNVTKQLISQWNSTKSLCTMIVGGKGVGKSTTARYLINNLLKCSEKVILLDLDPGQAEMTPSACLSLNILDKPLLGPNFTHLKTPFYQLYLKDINVSNCLTQYIECIKKLVACLKTNKDVTGYPVIVNSMGFCKGIGLDICIFLIKLIEPNNVIQIISTRTRNNFDFALVKQTVNECKTSSICWDDNDAVLEKICDYEFHYVSSMAEGKRQFESWNMEPRQQRELVLLSYFSQIIKNAPNTCFYNFTLNSINNIIPYVLPFSSFYISLLKSSIAPTHILAAMNGNVVALCGIDLDDDTPEDKKKSLKYPMVVIKPPPCTCYGYGIVRGVDLKKRCVYLNTPLTESELRHVNLLAGCSEMPFVLLHSGERASVPYAGDRGELPTSREPRRGYFRINHNNARNFKQR